MAEAATCGMHPDEAIVGACQKCGDFVCRRCLAGKRLVCIRCNPHGDATKPDLGVAFSYVFNDPAWVSKLLTGGLWMLLGFVIPILPFCVLMGYGVRTAQRERERPRRELPEWDGFGDLFVLGAKFYLCQLLPALVVMFLMALVVGGVIGLAVALGSAQKANDVAALVAGLGVMLVCLAIVPFSLAFAFFMPAIHLHHIRTGRIGAGLELRELWRIVAGRFSDYILLFLFHFVVQMAAGFAGELMCFVGLFITIPWSFCVQSYLVGRYAGWLDSEEGASPA